MPADLEAYLNASAFFPGELRISLLSPIHSGTGSSENLQTSVMFWNLLPQTFTRVQARPSWFNPLGHPVPRHLGTALRDEPSDLTPTLADCDRPL